MTAERVQSRLAPGSAALTAAWLTSLPDLDDLHDLVLASRALIRVLIVTWAVGEKEDELHPRATSGTRRTGDDG
jgi:hypothetical protein